MSADESQTPSDGPEREPAREGLEHRLDPDLAARVARRQEHGEGGAAAPRGAPEPVIDTRRYRWAIGIFGLALVIAFSIEQFATNGVHTTGVPSGKPLHYFAAPLANSTLSGDANLNPTCTLARHDPRALNVCLLVQRAPLVLAFFSPASSDCKRQVDTLQTLSRQFSPGVQFAAVAIRASKAQTATLIRSHHWTIPVAYDADGAVGSQYDIEICPVVELAARGGVVKRRLIGNHWLESSALEAQVRTLAG